ncbi:uncharacterized protein LOC126728193 [Quercus robur]|uniref:uncharacterized protein LOC126728193 n=1 Tax=Quercus robur TaxID=38942 RepID=UPI0021635742|nr:uncharacterized protein LOC126728193 [Quercus robur]
MKHFVGKPSNITSRIYDQLSNLRCKNLGEYRWYEDVFTTRVTHRSDCNSPFWKEKFINGLPTLFGQKVKETLASPLGVVDYDNLTDGDISSTIRNEGMKMCRDLKIQSQSNKSKAKKSKHKGGEPSEKSHRKKTTSKHYRKQKFKTDDFYKKGKSKSTGKFIPKASGKCFKCGKKGHLQKECEAKAKTLINTLISDQTSKEEIFKLLELDHSKSESSTREKYQLYRTSSETSRVSSSSSSDTDEILACQDSCCKNKTISVLSKQEELLLDLIEQIEDPVKKAQRLSEFHKTLVKEASTSKPKIQEPKVDLKKIYNRFTKSKKEITVQDL